MKRASKKQRKTLSEKIDDLTNLVFSIVDGLKVTNERIDDLAEMTARQFVRIDERFNKVDQRFAQIDEALVAMRRENLRAFDAIADTNRRVAVLEERISHA